MQGLGVAQHLDSALSPRGVTCSRFTWTFSAVRATAAGSAAVGVEGASAAAGTALGEARIGAIGAGGKASAGTDGTGGVGDTEADAADAGRGDKAGNAGHPDVGIPVDVSEPSVGGTVGAAAVAVTSAGGSAGVARIDAVAGGSPLPPAALGIRVAVSVEAGKVAAPSPRWS